MDLQVLSPMRKGPLGTIELNRLLQGEKPGPKVKYGQYTFHVGDKVIHTKNNYAKGVMNGDLGTVEEIKEIDGEPVLSVRYNGDVVEYAPGDLDELEPAWVITTHKSQGSEFNAVIVPVTTSHYIMLYRSLLYTAVTRAREKLVLVGTKKALALAIRNNRPVQRYTMLGHLL
jgi:exodeoxyribonuclease V alpha subunit